jgi:hypothetical protein
MPFCWICAATVRNMEGVRPLGVLFWETARLKPDGEAGGTSEQVSESPRLDKVEASHTAFCTEADAWEARYAEAVHINEFETLADGVGER